MVNQGIAESRDDLIVEIRQIQNELVFLKVKRELVNLQRMSDEDLTEFAEALRDQLVRRKKFLGAK